MLTLQDPRGWLLVALALLLLLSFAWRRRTRRVVLVPFFLLQRLAQSIPAAPRGFRLRRRLQWLLLAAALFAVAFAGLRPHYSSGAAAVRDLVIVDLSPSLGVLEGGRPRLRALRQRLDDYAALLQQQDAVVFVTAGPRAAASAPLAGGREAGAWLGGLDYADARADVAGAARLAARLAAADRYDHVLLFTDRASRWREQAKDDFAALSPRVITFGGATANAGIEAFDVQPATAGRAGYDLYLRVSCRGGEAPGREPPLALVISNNGRTLRRIERPCAPESPVELLLESVALEKGEAELALSPGDAYPADDRASAGVGESASAKVVLVTGGNGFLETAVRAAAPRELVVARPDAALPRDPAAVYLFDGRVPAGELPARALFIMPDRPPEGIVLQTYLSFPSRVEWDRGDPLLRHADLGGLAVRGYYAYAADPAYRVPVLADGRPLLLRRGDGGRRWVVLAFDPSETSLVYAPAYPILIANALHWLSLMGPEEQASLRVGAPVFLDAAACGGEIRTPAGDAIPLKPPCNPRLPFQGALHPGRYRVLSGSGAELGVFHANVDDPEVTAEIAAAGYGNGGAQLPADLERGPLSLDLAPWLALAALALLVAERALAPRRTSVLLP